MRKSDLKELKDFELLAELDDIDREALSREIVVREFETGTRLFEQGDPADSLLFVTEGSVRIQRETAEILPSSRRVRASARSRSPATGYARPEPKPRSARGSSSSRGRASIASSRPNPAARAACCKPSCAISKASSTKPPKPWNATTADGSSLPDEALPSAD